MYALRDYAQQTPNKVAYCLEPSGYSINWAQLELRTRVCAAALLGSGLQAGDVIAVYMENHPYYFEILIAAHRAGLYYTTVSRHLKPDELHYVIDDSGAKVLFCSEQTYKEIPKELIDNDALLCILVSEPNKEPIKKNTCIDYQKWLAPYQDVKTLPDTLQGTDFCYSSGTTGRPKGIKRELGEANEYFRVDESERFNWKRFDRESVYLSTAPFYHTAPVRWNMSVLRAGGSSIMMERFDAEQALSLIERYKVTHAQWVPTMFIRMLKLPESVRQKYELSSMRYAVHAAAPCPIEIKEAMIEWWGPILYEYYSGTELVGRTSLDSFEWLEHKGSVGRPEFGAVHIVDETGAELPPNQVGKIYFSGGAPFSYHNDPEKTKQAYNEKGWGTYGDIGYVDEDGYLYVTDRSIDMIISGGVNIYPQEIESCLALHSAVKDVAVIGVPDPEFGESVKAVVQLHDFKCAGPEMAETLINYCRSRISHVKSPKSIDFVEILPRTDSGKLLKRLLKEKYWQKITKIKSRSGS